MKQEHIQAFDAMFDAAYAAGHYKEIHAAAMAASLAAFGIEASYSSRMD